MTETKKHSYHNYTLEETKADLTSLYSQLRSHERSSEDGYCVSDCGNEETCTTCGQCSRCCDTTLCLGYVVNEERSKIWVRISEANKHIAVLKSHPDYDHVQDMPMGVMCIVRVRVPAEPLCDGGRMCGGCEGAREGCEACDGSGSITVCGRCHEDADKCVCESIGTELVLATRTTETHVTDQNGRLVKDIVGWKRVPKL